ncbi:MAG: DeoR family transcriptional regulator [Candidatus Omnitrophica bacterium]|nr:DeoR family transcriptional regulator [Candidatus Omnitrophota bacterium]
MVKTVDYESRRRAVLSATINRYIKNAQPVASEDIAAEFDLSPATIRNIFAELEEANYLTHPYTSGGRIPTKKGYRYYVDFLLSQVELIDEEKEQITKEYKRKMSRVEEALDKTTEIISAITHYAGISSFPESQERFFYRGISLVLNQPEFQDSQKIRLLIKVIEDKQYLLNIINRDFSDKVKVYIGEELDCPGMEGCSLVVSTYRTKGKSSGRLAVLGPMRMEYKHTIPALEYISGVLTEVMSGI